MAGLSKKKKRQVITLTLKPDPKQKYSRLIWDMYIKDEYSGKEVDLEGIDKLDTLMLDIYCIETFLMYDNNLCNKDFWEKYRVNFNGWEVKHFNRLNQILKLKIINHLFKYSI